MALLSVKTLGSRTGMMLPAMTNIGMLSMGDSTVTLLKYE